MKKYLLLITIILVVLIYSCSKKDDPTPQSPPPATLSISDFNPKSAMVGAAVMITGTAFGTDSNAVSISFGGSADVKPKVITSTSMTAYVPSDAQTGNIQITINSKTVTSASIFTLTKTPPPLATISGFSPQSGKVGDTVTITGTNFGTDTNFVSIKFGTSGAVKPKTVTATKMTVIVPADAQTGTIQIAVNGAAPVTSANSFTLKTTPITITGFAPTSGAVGDTVIVTGTQFGSNISNVVVYINGGSAIKPIAVTPTKISVIVPSNATSGKILVSVKGVSVTSTASFTVLPVLIVASITPDSARATEVVSINGDFHQTDALSSIVVRFYGSAMTVNPLSIDAHNDIMVKVPTDAKTGKITVSKTGYAASVTENTLKIIPPLPPIQTGVWTAQPNFLGSGKVGAFSFTANNKAYVGCGTTNAPFDSFGSSDVWQYDPQYNAWSQVADYGGGSRVYAAAFSIANKGFVGTGLDGNAATTSDFWEYDPTANNWTQKANFSGSARSDAVGFAIGSTGYIGTGINGGSLSDFYAYNPTANAWTQVAAIPAARSDAFSFVIGSQAYVGNGQLSADLYAYNPTTNVWTSKTPMPNNNTGCSSFAVNGKGYVGLGAASSGSGGTTTFYAYDPNANNWTTLPSFSGTKRLLAVGFAINNVGYFGMGAGSPHLVASNDFWAYKP